MLLENRVFYQSEETLLKSQSDPIFNFYFRKTFSS